MRHDGRYEFSGTVVDGPDRGKRVVQHAPYYRAPVYSPSAFHISYIEQPCAPVINYVEYHWSYSLDQWCMRY